MKRILIVDDSPTMLMSMEGVLKRNGYAVETATSAKQAISKAPNFKPDLMITDLNMPEMNGIELIKELKRTPAMRFKPMLMLTTESQQAKRDEAKRAGATGWLVKPVQPDELTGVVKKVLPA
ncbi:response regulator [Opacimonas viscosa]|uniref:Response regulator n=1 Tax=Opacimonas viscosa TaxID=2961944 RepID=A0AA42BQG0_9ALTE|nr:response regulator [Opacimonas viscosa]MCP3429446.1 response regulator [Opacimonas viscosa]